MRIATTTTMAAAVIALTAAPVFAQESAAEKGWENAPGFGGVRVEIPMQSRVLPYVLGWSGVARLSPSAVFTFQSGTMPDGSTPTVGQDVTSAITTAGAFTQPPSSTAFMFTLGGGVQTLIAPHWVVDAGYRYSRIAADTTLSASPLNANGLTFGVGYRF